MSTKLVTDPSVHVRASLAEAVCKIAPVVGQDNSIDHLVPIVTQLIKDANTEVRLSLMAHIGLVCKTIGKEPTDKHIIPSIIELCNDKQWRVRYSTIEFFPKLAEMIDHQLFKDKLESVTIQLLSDIVFSIRERSIDNLIEMRLQFGQDWFENLFITKFTEFITNPKCHMRLTAILMARKSVGKIDKRTMNEKLIPAIIILYTDKVPNVRFNIPKFLDEAEIIINEKNV